MAKNLCDQYIDRLKQVEKLSVDSITAITVLYELTRCERDTVNRSDDGGNAASDSWRKWIAENDEIIKILKRTIHELNKFTYAFED